MLDLVKELIHRAPRHVLEDQLAQPETHALRHMHYQHDGRSACRCQEQEVKDATGRLDEGLRY
jgi:hypothetical protein